MKRYLLIFTMLLAGGAAALTAGCSGGNNGKEQPETAVSASSEPDSGEEGAASSSDPVSASGPLVNEPEEEYPDVEQMGEGVASGSLPEETDTIAAEFSQPFTFTRDGQELYTVTVEQAGLTDRRAVAETTAPEAVLLLNYSYLSLTGDPVLVDDMSFQCFTGEGEACTAYYLADQLIPEVNQGGEPTEAEVAFSIPEDTQEAVVCVTNNSNPEGETYSLEIQL